MNCNKIISGALLLSVSLSANAGFWGFTMHSRANCVGFNESISWHAGHSYYLMTYSHHVSTKPANWWVCRINTPMEATWRSAAYHYAEGYKDGEWKVTGAHYTRNAAGNAVLMMMTFGHDCAGYNGWWDKSGIQRGLDK